MQPWGTVAGRIVDENGNAFSGDERGSIMIHSDPNVGLIDALHLNEEGRFRIDRLIPDVRYGAEAYRGPVTFAGLAFEDLVIRRAERSATWATSA